MENSQPHALGLTDRRPAALGDFRVLPDDLICDILEYLHHRDVARLACVSSVMYILCNEEPLWMSLCLSKVNGPLQYKGSWKKTALDLEHVPYECDKTGRKPLYFDGFNSLFLYRRLYRCYTTLDGFAFDDGNVERKKDLTLEDFSRDYDGKKPVLLTGLADAWPARHTWTFDQLLQKYGDTAFKISQRSARKVSMKFKDYVSYLKIQHDEDPLYIFDHKFGEVAPALLKDYSVPCLFQEDFFDVLDGDKRPPFRWLIIGPQRSGASWHVDPALTSAWNTLLVGRKSWGTWGACLALNAGRWSECLSEICAFHNLPHPAEDEKLPVGTGSNPVYLFSDCVVKIFVEEGLERSLYGLGTELEFYNLLCKVNSPLKNHMPDVLESGIIYLENGIYRIIPWDAKTVPDVIARCNLIPEKLNADICPFGVWSKKQFNYRKAGMPTNETIGSPECRRIWPYLITKRCKGKIYAELRDTISLEGALNLASFLGEQLRNLHLLPQPPLSISTFLDIEQEIDMPLTNGFMEAVQDKSEVPAEWNIFIRTLFRKKKDASSRLSKWGDPIPTTLIEKVDEYLPDDLATFLHIFEDENGLNKVGKLCSWIHSDIMDDNIHMEPCGANSCLIENTKDNGLVTNGSVNGNGISAGTKSWRPSHILDFSDLSIGDPIYDIIPIYLDVFRGDARLLKQLLESYKLPLVSAESQKKSVKGGDKFGQLSYHAMCYCILHDENVLGAIFSIWDELKTAKTWEEVEQVVWGELNNYKGFPLDPKI
ncbi:lysine-specific demethylase JMJ21-like [Pyrus communis]|uniref:lysine-specific demethylase JMJ21-like n=1 Tax=Pyrus communis TaxID=23211 RepID=UPI0035C126A5